MRALRWSACLLCGLALPAAAGDATDDWTPVPDTALAETRGTQEAGNGLLLALGVERLVEVNGSVVASSRFDLASLARLQDGTLASAQEALAPILVQNSLNGQLIRSLTTIDVTVNTLATLKSLNLEGSLRQALSNVLTPR